jgi:hypothetical protein
VEYASTYPSQQAGSTPVRQTGGARRIFSLLPTSSSPTSRRGTVQEVGRASAGALRRHRPPQTEARASAGPGRRAASVQAGGGPRGRRGQALPWPWRKAGSGADGRSGCRPPEAKRKGGEAAPVRGGPLVVPGRRGRARTPRIRKELGGGRSCNGQWGEALELRGGARGK